MTRVLIACLAVLALVVIAGGCGRTTAPPPEKPSATAPPATSAPAHQGTPTGAAAEKPVAATEKPVAAEKNPPGDIPDTQVFVKYVSPAGGYELQVPEGWARKTEGSNVTFTDKLDGLEVVVTKETAAPSTDSVTRNQVAVLRSAGRAVQVKGIKNVQCPGGAAILLTYQSNSAPDPVTGKQVRLEDSSYLFYKQGKLATVHVWAPAGADNVDQWKLISDSFRWR
jgi:hypothetical protein